MNYYAAYGSTYAGRMLTDTQSAFNPPTGLTQSTLGIGQNQFYVAGAGGFVNLDALAGFKPADARHDILIPDEVRLPNYYYVSGNDTPLVPAALTTNKVSDSVPAAPPVNGFANVSQTIDNVVDSSLTGASGGGGAPMGGGSGETAPSRAAILLAQYGGQRPDTKPDADPRNAVGNWDLAIGQLHHSNHTLKMTISPRESRHLTKEHVEELLREQLRSFELFNFGANDIARVNVADETEDGATANFDLLGLSGWLSDLTNDDKVQVALSYDGDVVSGQTIGDHQLVGVRRWSFTVSGEQADGFTIEVKTEAYEKTRGVPNTIGMLLVGEAEQAAVWTAYLTNIKSWWSQSFDATGGVTRSSEWLGDAPNPWAPAKKPRKVDNILELNLEMILY